MRSTASTGRAGRALVFTAPQRARGPGGPARYAQQVNEWRGSSQPLWRARLGCGFQSEAGRPEDPWLGPDVVSTARHRGHVPGRTWCLGFVCDHIEVLYDRPRSVEVSRSGLDGTVGNGNDDPMFRLRQTSS